MGTSMVHSMVSHPFSKLNGMKTERKTAYWNERLKWSEWMNERLVQKRHVKDARCGRRAIGKSIRTSKRTLLNAYETWKIFWNWIKCFSVLDFICNQTNEWTNKRIWMKFVWKTVCSNRNVFPIFDSIIWNCCFSRKWKAFYVCERACVCMCLSCLCSTYQISSNS